MALEIQSVMTRFGGSQACKKVLWNVVGSKNASQKHRLEYGRGTRSLSHIGKLCGCQIRVWAREVEIEIEGFHVQRITRE